MVLDEKLLKAADQAAKRENVNRSALICQALQEHRKSLAIRTLEEQYRRGYEAKPQRKEEYLPWENAAV